MTGHIARQLAAQCVAIDGSRVTRVFDQGVRPFGWLIATGVDKVNARDLASNRNWRLRVVIRALRAARLEAQRVGDDARLKPGEFRLRVHVRRAWRRKLEVLAYDLRELLKQRARMRRNRGRQLDLFSGDNMPNWTDDDGVSRFNDAGSAAAGNARHSSETFEHGTPPDVVDAAHNVMGGIDLDPASCEKANAYVEATNFFSLADNGFLQPWHGRVFLNPPGGLMELDTGRPVFIKTKKRQSCTVTGACGLPPGHKHENVGSSAGAWWRKLAREYVECRVTEAIFIGFSLEILQTTQVADDGLPTPLDFPICYPRKRLDYIALEKPGIVKGGAPTHASFIAYLGKSTHAPPLCWHFARVFAVFGKVVGPGVDFPRGPDNEVYRSQADQAVRRLAGETP